MFVVVIEKMLVSNLLPSAKKQSEKVSYMGLHLTKDELYRAVKLMNDTAHVYNDMKAHGASEDEIEEAKLVALVDILY